MSDPAGDEKPLPYVAMSVQQTLQVVALGLMVGLLVWALSYVFDQYVFQAVLCHGNSSNQCASASQYGGALASILASGIGLFGLMKLQVFRPLLVVLTTVVGLWNLPDALNLLPLYGVALACAFLFALAYGTFTWVARLRSFVPTIIIMIALVVAIRLILTS